MDQFQEINVVIDPSKDDGFAHLRNRNTIDLITAIDNVYRDRIIAAFRSVGHVIASRDDVQMNYGQQGHRLDANAALIVTVVLQGPVVARQATEDFACGVVRTQLKDRKPLQAFLEASKA